MATYGPGAVGVGWELGLMGLGEHLATGTTIPHEEVEGWGASADGQAFMSGSATRWGEADAADLRRPGRLARGGRPDGRLLHRRRAAGLTVHAFDVLGDPVRRRILELLAAGETSAGDVAARVGGEFGISQPAVSQHLKVLRDNGFATVRAEGTRRLYAVDPSGPAGGRRLGRAVPGVLGPEARRARHRDRPRQEGPPLDSA